MHTSQVTGLARYYKLRVEMTLANTRWRHFLSGTNQSRSNYAFRRLSHFYVTSEATLM